MAVTMTGLRRLPSGSSPGWGTSPWDTTTTGKFRSTGPLRKISPWRIVTFLRCSAPRTRIGCIRSQGPPADSPTIRCLDPESTSRQFSINLRREESLGAITGLLTASRRQRLCSFRTSRRTASCPRRWSTWTALLPTSAQATFPRSHISIRMGSWPTPSGLANIHRGTLPSARTGLPASSSPSWQAQCGQVVPFFLLGTSLAGSTIMCLRRKSMSGATAFESR